jgi:hypothetical protein
MKAMKATKVSDAPIQAVVVAEIADQPSLSDKLRELQSAQDAGLMSPEDFAATKTILLASFSGGQGAVVSQPQISQPLEPKAVHPKASLVSGSMILVRRGDPMQCIFNEATALRAGRTARLTLASHPGKSISRRYSEERNYGEWRYTESELANCAVRVSFVKGNFLKLADADLVLDVSFWRFQPGSTVNFVGGRGDRTFLGGGGRDWAINEDGTISSKHHPNLVLGTHPPPSELTSPETRISTTDIAGKCWMCLCFPGGWACFEKIANGENGLIHRGMVCLFFGLPLGFEERRWRVPNTNGFYKENERGNVDHYCSPSCVCNGISCSTKPC